MMFAGKPITGVWEGKLVTKDTFKKELDKRCNVSVSGVYLLIERKLCECTGCDCIATQRCGARELER